jgi:transcriptional regulator with XRE-family HTH domain
VRGTEVRLNGLTSNAWRPKGGGRLKDGRYIELLSVHHLWGGGLGDGDAEHSLDEVSESREEVLERLLTRVPPLMETVVRSMLSGESQTNLAERLGVAQSTVSIWHSTTAVAVLRRVAGLGVDLTPDEVFDHVRRVCPKQARTRPNLALFIKEYWRWHSTSKVAKALGAHQMTVWCALFDKTGFVNVAPADDPVAKALREMQTWGGFNGLR